MEPAIEALAHPAQARDPSSKLIEECERGLSDLWCDIGLLQLSGQEFEFTAQDFNFARYRCCVFLLPRGKHSSYQHPACCVKKS